LTENKNQINPAVLMVMKEIAAIFEDFVIMNDYKFSSIKIPV